MEQKTIICDVCGKEIDYANTISTRTIAKDAEGRDVIEQFFTCQSCGAHYTIMIIDSKMKIMIQKRKQLQNKVPSNRPVRHNRLRLRAIPTMMTILTTILCRSLTAERPFGRGAAPVRFHVPGFLFSGARRILILSKIFLPAFAAARFYAIL